MDFAGWQSIDAPLRDQRWIAVRDARVAPVPVLKSVHDIHLWVRHHIRYERDANGDQWQQPFETLGWGKGDCEDIALLERALLIAAGWSSSLMWIVLARDLVVREVHAVLIYDRFLLDCRTDRIGAAAAAKDYFPIIGFCDDRCVTFGRKRP